MEQIRWKFLTLLFAVLQVFFLEALVNAEAISPESGEAKRSLEPESPVLGKRQSPPPGFYPILGANSIGGQCYNRRNIEVLQTADPTEFNMLLLAFSELQTDSTINPDLSWFGVGGIHGAPYTEWQQQPLDNRPFNPGVGYCVHHSPLFSLWHRPYILLVEQLAQERAVQIARRFGNTNPDRSRYLAAADRLRLPYMDWSDIAYRGRVPSFVMTPQIRVTRPLASGLSETVMINNPLYRYNFRTSELAQLPAGAFRTYRYTTREPQGVLANPISSDARVNNVLQSTWVGRHQNTFNLFTWTNFNSFSTQCENVHNGIHSIIGTISPGSPPGHMGFTLAAAFDPIFWLHHVMIDRLIAMYQVAYPTRQLTPYPGMATFGRVVPGRDGPQDSLNTNLYPFRKADGTMYKGADFVSGGPGRTGIWNYHYGYPEIPCGSTMTAAQLSSNVIRAVNTLYRPTGRPSLPGRSLRRRQNETLPEPPAGPTPGEENGYAPLESEVGMVRTEYNLRLFIDLAEMVGAWACHIFLGPVPSRLDEYWTCRSHCGIFAPFAAPGQRMESMPFTYEIALTDKLLSLGVPPNETETYLTDNLRYVMVAEDGKIIDISSLETFKAGIITTEGTYGEPGSDTLATFTDCTVLYSVTEDKPGGVASPAEFYEPTLLNGTSQDLNTTLVQF